MSNEKENQKRILGGMSCIGLMFVLLLSACASSPGTTTASSPAAERPASRTESLPTIRIANKTGFTIYYVYISRHSNDSWGQDWLGNDVLMNGNSVSFTLQDPLSVTSTYDIRLKDEEGDTYTKMNVSIRAGSQIEFTMSDFDVGTIITNPNQNRNTPLISIVNHTGYTIYFVQISQTASTSWGADQLDDRQVLRNGDIFRCHLPYALDVVNRYDIRLQDEDGDTYTKMDVRVSADSRIVFTIRDFDS